MSSCEILVDCSSGPVVIRVRAASLWPMEPAGLVEIWREDDSVVEWIWMLLVVVTLAGMR